MLINLISLHNWKRGKQGDSGEINVSDEKTGLDSCYGIECGEGKRITRLHLEPILLKL